jgi:hypothetical protein
MISKKYLCAGVLVVVTLFKFWLIAEMEITDDPDDPPNYIAQILGSGPSFFGPGTGWFGKLFFHTGIPFRDGIEIFYLVSCVLLVRVLFAWPFQTWSALSLFVFLFFNPAPEELFSHMESDQIWLVETLLGLSLFNCFIFGRTMWRWLWLGLASLSLGFATITRMSIIPLVFSFLVWAAIAGVLWWLKCKPRRIDFPILAGTVACLILIGTLNVATCYYNFVQYHYFGLSIVDCREYADFYMSLQSVGDATGEKYYPVDEQRLGLIAKAGPISHWFVDHVNTDQNFRRIGREHYGTYDFALPWFCFVIYFNAVPSGDLNQGFAMFKEVEGEIAQAARENRIKVRRIIPLPDSRLGILLGAMPEACRSVHANIVTEPTRYAWSEWPDEPKFESPAFTLALNRRTVTASPLRETIGEVLCTFYRTAYWPMLLTLEAVLAAYFAALLFQWRKVAGFSARFLGQQLYLVVSICFFGWYVLFIASGLLMSFRYVIFQNVMLPILLAYYAREAWRLWKQPADYSS